MRTEHISNPTDNRVKLSAISEGQCFELDSEIYLKTDEPENYPNLRTGAVYSFNLDCLVNPIDAKVVWDYLK